MLRTVFPFIIWAIVFIPMIVTSSQPLLPPGYCYGLSGFVVSADDESAENYAVVLYGQGRDFVGWFRVEPYNGGRVDFTDARGRYQISGCFFTDLDSLAAAVVLPDTIILGPPVSTAGLFMAEEEEPFTDDGFLCDETGWRVVNYHYELVDSVFISVP